jgi:hypothetical protein
METIVPEENVLANYGAWRLKAITPHTQKLLDDFPKLFRPCASPFGDWGFQCNKGWFDLVYQLCADIEQAATAAKLDPNSDRWPLMEEIKAKFAVLRVVIDLLNPDEQDDELVQRIDALIKEAEDKSSAMCEGCGAVGTPKTNRNGWWIRITCTECEEKREKF